MNTTMHLRRLLDAFYAGTATPEQVDEIRHIFDGLPQTPEDLIADRQMFEALYATSIDATPLPDNLQAIVSETIDRITHQPTTKKHPLILGWIRYAAAAAVVAIVATIGIRLLPHDTPGTSAYVNNTLTAASALPSKTETTIHDTSTASVLVDNQPISADNIELVPTPEVKTRHAKIRKSHRNSNLHVVSDPKEAEAYTLMALNTLADNINHARKASSRIGAELNEINNTLNTILK